VFIKNPILGRAALPFVRNHWITFQVCFRLIFRIIYSTLMSFFKLHLFTHHKKSTLFFDLFLTWVLLLLLSWLWKLNNNIWKIIKIKMPLFSLLLWYYKCVIFALYRLNTVIGGSSPLMTLSIIKYVKE